MSENLLKQFQNQYKLIQEHRENRDAPVDSMGTGALDYPEDPKTRRFQILVSTLLSAQTKDEKTSAAVYQLQEHDLSVDMICNIDEEKLAELIKGVRFAKRKANNMKKTATILQQKYATDIPKTYEELCDLPGIGTKMALVIMECAWDQCMGIGVDSHVHRIANRLGWVKDAKDSEYTRAQLEELVPEKYWPEISSMVIGFGQQICTSKPLCEKCKLSDSCAFYQN